MDVPLPPPLSASPPFLTSAYRPVTPPPTLAYDPLLRLSTPPPANKIELRWTLDEHGYPCLPYALASPGSGITTASSTAPNTPAKDGWNENTTDSCEEEDSTPVWRERDVVGYGGGLHNLEGLIVRPASLAQGEEKVATSKPRVRLITDCLYLLAYDIRPLLLRTRRPSSNTFTSHPFPSNQQTPIIAWTLAYALTPTDLICLPKIEYDARQRSWIGSACSWTWVDAHLAQNILLCIKLSQPSAVPLDLFLSLVHPPYPRRVVQLAIGRQYLYVRMMREACVGFVRRLGGVMHTVADDFPDDVRRFTHLVKLGSVAHVTLEVFL